MGGRKVGIWEFRGLSMYGFRNLGLYAFGDFEVQGF